MVKSLAAKAKKNKKGFTLIELIVVIAILAILAAILIPAVGGFISKSKAQAAQSDARNVYTAIQSFMSDPNMWMPAAGTNKITISSTTTAHTTAETTGAVNYGDITKYMGSTMDSTELGSITVTYAGAAGSDPDLTLSSVTVTKNGVKGTYPSTTSGSAAA